MNRAMIEPQKQIHKKTSKIGCVISWLAYKWKEIETKKKYTNHEVTHHFVDIFVDTFVDLILWFYHCSYEYMTLITHMHASYSFLVTEVLLLNINRSLLCNISCLLLVFDRTRDWCSSRSKWKIDWTSWMKCPSSLFL